MLRKISAPEELTNKYIQNIGKQYIKDFGVTPGFFRNNQPTAISLKNYADDSTLEEKWIFLADTYTKLNGAYFSVIGNEIIGLFIDAFKRPIDTNTGNTDFIAGVLKDIARQYFLAKKVNDLEEIVNSLKINT